MHAHAPGYRTLTDHRCPPLATPKPRRTLLTRPPPSIPPRHLLEPRFSKLPFHYRNDPLSGSSFHLVKSPNSARLWAMPAIGDVTFSLATLPVLAIRDIRIRWAFAYTHVCVCLCVHERARTTLKVNDQAPKFKPKNERPQETRALSTPPPTPPCLRHQIYRSNIHDESKTGARLLPLRNRELHAL